MVTSNTTQTITGTKTFNNPIYRYGSNLDPSSTSNLEQAATLMRDTNNTLIGQDMYSVNASYIEHRIRVINSNLTDEGVTNWADLSIRTTSDKKTSVLINKHGNLTLDLPSGDNTNKIPTTQWVQGELGGYSKTSHTHSYLPLSGGTISGTLTLKTDSNNNALIKNGGTNGMIQLSADAGGMSKGLLRLYGSTYGTSSLRGGFSIGCDGAKLESFPGLHSNLMWNNTAVSLDGHTHSEYVYSAGNGLSLSSKSFSVNASLLHTMNTVKGTNPSSNLYHELISYDNSDNGSGASYRFAAIGRRLQTDGLTGAYLQAYDATAGSTSSSSLGVFYPKGGTPYTVAPNPPNEDSSTKIATTSWVGKYGGVTSFSSMNYIAFKSGLKIMMGKHACSTTGFTKVQFPIEFTNTPDIVCTIKAEVENTVYNTAKMYNPSNTEFYVASIEGTAYTNRTIHWIAIGV